MARPGGRSTKLRYGMRFETWCASDHPVYASKVASQHLLDGAATPPLRGGEHPFLQFIHTFLRPGLNYAAASRL